MKRFRYLTCCIDSTGEAISAMTEAASPVTYATIRRHVVDLDEWAAKMKYDVGNQRGGLRLKNDWAVSYWKSLYLGKPCYFIDHSAIEYIFTEGDHEQLRSELHAGYPSGFVQRIQTAEMLGTTFLADSRRAGNSLAVDD